MPATILLIKMFCSIPREDRNEIECDVLVIVMIISFEMEWLC